MVRLVRHRSSGYRALALLAGYALFSIGSIGVCEEPVPDEGAGAQPPDARLTVRDSWLHYEGKRLLVPPREDPRQFRWRREQTGESAEAPQSSGIEEARSLRLSRADSVKLVLQRNQDLVLGRMRYEARKWGVRKERAAYEPEFVASATTEFGKRENTVEEALSQTGDIFSERNYLYSTALEGRVATGASYRIGYTLNVLSNNLVDVTRPSRGLYDDEYQSFLGLELTQPLLRNAWPKSTLAPLRIAKMEAELDFQDLRKQVMSTIAQTESLYWDLVFAQESHKAATASVGTAKKILEDNRERVKKGKMAPLEVEAAEAGLAARETRQSQASQMQKELANQLGTLSATCLADVRVTATDLPNSTPVDIDYSESMTRAIKSNPDYLRGWKEAKRQDLRLVFARRQRWPQLDLKASYGLNGLGSTIDRSWDDVSGSNFKSWSVGVELRVPVLGGQRDRSAFMAAKLDKQQALHRLKSLETDLANTLDTIVQSEKTARKELASAQLNARFNDRLLALELDRLEAGKSDSRKVLDIEEDLFQARIDELGSRVRYEKLLMLLEVTQGTLLENRSVEIEER